MTRLALGVLLAGALACDRGVPPPYTRLSGTAPSITPAASPTRATLVVFWASWCAPCVEETPSLLRLARQPPDGLSVVVLDRDETLADVTRFFKGPPPEALNLRLDEGNALGAAFGADTLPITFLIVGGQRVARFSGPQDWDAKPMRALLERLIRP